MEPVTLRLPKDMLARIEALREQRMDAPDRSAFVRECLARGVTVMEKEVRR